MSFTDEKPFVATAEYLKYCWGGGKPGERFRCHLCGHKFKVGDIVRWVFTNNVRGAEGNLLVCSVCDGPDVIIKWKQHNEDAEELLNKFWWFVK